MIKKTMGFPGVGRNYRTYSESELTSIGAMLLACTTSVTLTGAFVLLRSRKIRKDKQNALEAVWHDIN